MKKPTKYVTLYRQKGSPYFYARFTLPPSVRRSFDPSQADLAAPLFASGIRPDKRNRCTVSLRTGDKRHADALRADIEQLVRKAWDGALTRDVFNALSRGSGSKLVTVEDFFSEIASSEEKRVQLSAISTNPLEAQKRAALTPETAKRREMERKNFSDFLSEDAHGRTLYVSDVTPPILVRFKDWMLQRYTVATYTHARNYLSGLWAAAVSKDYCDRNPWRVPDLRARRDPKRDWPVLTAEDRKAILSAPASWPVNGLIVMMFTGARSSDLVWLQRSHVDFATGDLTLFQSKTAKFVRLDGVLNLVPDLKEALRRQLESHSSLFVFPKADGERNTRQYLNKQFNSALKKIVGNHVSAHTFRRSAATLLDEYGVPLPVIRDYLGHATVEQTLLYIQRRKAGVAQAASRLAVQRS